jgi:DNA-binding CsgD family transcriptional regulator
VLRPGLRELPARILAQLGKVPDRQLAERAGVHLNTILHERRRRGIPAFVQQREDVRWTRAMIRKLGTDTDRSVAAELGIPVGCVSRKRRILGIPPVSGRSGSHPRAYPWAPEELASLGRVSDRTLARTLGLSPRTVATKRQMLGIPPWRPRPPAVVWTPAMRRLLGRVSDSEVARRFSISSSTVVLERRRLGIPPVVDRRGIEHPAALLKLLRLPLSEVRRRTGLNPKTIAALRTRYGIHSLRAAELRYTPEVVARMGKESDEAIAIDLGCTPSAVRQKRQSLGIPAYQGFRRLPRRRRAGRSHRRS